MTNSNTATATKTTATKITTAKTTGKKPVAKPAQKPVAVLPAPAPLQLDDITAIDYKPGYYTPEKRAELKACTELIQKALDKIDGGLEAIAFTLWKVYSSGLYRSECCCNVCDYAAKHFDYKKTTVYSFLSVVDRFALRDDKGAIVDGKFVPLAKGYSFSKLSLMTSLTDAQIEKHLKATMSVRDIKKCIKDLRSDAPAQLPVTNDNVVDASAVEKDSEHPENDKTSPNFRSVSVKDVSDYNKKLDGIDDMIEGFIKENPNAKKFDIMVMAIV